MISYNEFVDYLKDEKFLNDKEIALMLYCIEQEYGGYLEALEANGYEEIDRDTYTEALEAVADEFEVTSSYDSDLFECANMEFWVFDDHDEAEEKAVEQVKDLLDDIGYTSIEGWEDYVDEEWFEEAMRESYDSYAEDIENEGSDEFENRLVEECYERDLIDDADFDDDENGEPDHMSCRVDFYKLQEMLADDCVDDEMSHYRYASAWYMDNFGEESFNDAVENNNLIDEDEISEYVVRSDGAANTLSSYDCEENEYDFEGTTYWIYRTN